MYRSNIFHIIVISSRISRSTLDDAREALTKYLASFSRRSTPKHDELLGEGEQSAATSVQSREPRNDDAYDKIDLGKSFNVVVQLYGRAVSILRDRRERELLAEALCDLGDLHVSNEPICSHPVLQSFVIAIPRVQSLRNLSKTKTEQCARLHLDPSPATLVKFATLRFFSFPTHRLSMETTIWLPEAGRMPSMAFVPT